MPIPKHLIEEQNKATEALRSYIADNEAGRIPEGEAEERYERINAELTKVEESMVAYRRLDDADAELRAAREAGDDLARRQDEDNDHEDSRLSADELAVRALISGEAKSVEFRDLNVGTAIDGGNTVSTGFVSQLRDKMTEHAAIRQTRATVVRTSTGNALQFPKVTTHSSAALVAEAGTIAESDAAFGQVTLNAYKYAFRTLISHELENDTEVNLLGFLAGMAGRALGDATGAAAITADGSSKPQGLDGVLTTGVTAAGAAAITGDELIDLQHSVLSPYRTNAEWMFRDATLALIRKLKDGDGNYLWQPARAVDGAPGTLLGNPYVVDPNVPAATTGNNSVFFGDFSAFYLRDVESVRAERSEHVGWNTDQVSWRFIVRFDSDLVDTTGAIKTLTQA